MENSKDKVMPEGKWEFDSEVAGSFDDMLSRSIPQYDLMRSTCVDIARRFVKPSTDIVDVGCSRGEAMAPLVKEFGAYNRFVGLEISEPMLLAARTRFKGYIDTNIVNIWEWDLRTGYPNVVASVTLSVLTIQFTPIEHRMRILSDIYKSIMPGGCLIFVEKVIGNTADIDAMMTGLYYRLKAENGYTQDQIERKKLSLEGVLVPVTAQMNEMFLRSAGFSQIDCFWRWMNFMGWVCIK